MALSGTGLHHILLKLCLFSLFPRAIFSKPLPVPAKGLQEKGDCFDDCLDLSAYNFFGYIAWSANRPWQLILHVYEIQADIIAEVDSSFSGFITPATPFKFSEDYPPEGGVLEYVYRPSTGELFRGFWHETELTFTSGYYNDGGVGLAQGNTYCSPSVFLMTNKIDCPTYDPASGNGTCPDQTATWEAASVNVIGIGFGGPAAEGSTVSIPDRNPFLNVVSIGSYAMHYNASDVQQPSDRLLRKGFMVDPVGITVGLARDAIRILNNGEMTWLQKLEPAASGERYDWLPPVGCVTIDGGECIESYWIPDTSPSADILYTDDTITGTVSITEPSGALTPAIANGSEVEVRLNSYAGNYSFKIDDGKQYTPPNVFVKGQQAGKNYVNAGENSKLSVYTSSVNLFDAYGYVYDAEGGYFGLQHDVAQDSSIL